MKVPYDADAEANVVGCALARPRPAHYDARDCYVPAHARLLDAAKELYDVVPQLCDPASVDWPGLWPMTYPGFEHLRATAAATIADVGFDVAHRLVDGRYEPGVVRDVECVMRAAKARRVMMVLAEAYNALGDGAEVDDVASLVSGVVA